MKVDVTTPDDPEVEGAPEQDAQAAPAEQAPAGEEPSAEEADAPAPGTDDAMDAEYEPVESKGGRGRKAAEEEVFSLADLEAARADAKAANEKYLRLQAEWDNYRKRTARERQDERARAAESLVEKLLPVVDDLERSLDHAAKTQPDGAFADFVAGVKAVYDKLEDVLAKEGVEVIDPAGQPFDMNEHQAVAHVEDPSLPSSTVRDVYQKGYRMGGHIIRSAMVSVSKGGPERPAAEPEGAGEEPKA